MKNRLAILLLALLPAFTAAAQKDFGGVARFSATVIDMGKVDIRDGAVNCSFEVTNIGSEPLNIFAVTSSCSCTSAKWTREDIAPGASGTINVTYTNDEGPYPFDKTLTVYISGYERPVILHVKGTSFKSKKK
ncbi:MAG: DUF1573 domain-containing protein [Bacteroidales bacterium]|nr:DUF1573 domain-containing protein [Bacteroidales bacterium]MBP5720909.1 DUF1573 domain-containing protein [Bacteroidales bacterium]